MKKQQFENSLNIISSTTTFSKVRGYSIDILYLLKEGMLTSSDIAELTGKYAQFINVYLNRLRKYGMAEKQGSFWKITEEGLYFLTHLDKIGHIKRQIKQKVNRFKTDVKQKVNTSTQNKPKQLSIQLFIKNSHRSLSDIEVEVVDILLDHYNKTGSKWIYAHAGLLGLAERLKVDYDSLGRALLNLRQDGVIYTWPKLYERQTFKLGLKNAFLKKLEATARLETTASES